MVAAGRTERTQDYEAPVVGSSFRNTHKVFQRTVNPSPQKSPTARKDFTHFSQQTHVDEQPTEEPSELDQFTRNVVEPPSPRPVTFSAFTSTPFFQKVVSVEESAADRSRTRMQKTQDELNDRWSNNQGMKNMSFAEYARASGPSRPGSAFTPRPPPSSRPVSARRHFESPQLSDYLYESDLFRPQPPPSQPQSARTHRPFRPGTARLPSSQSGSSSSMRVRGARAARVPPNVQPSPNFKYAGRKSDMNKRNTYSERVRQKIHASQSVSPTSRRVAESAKLSDLSLPINLPQRILPPSFMNIPERLPGRMDVEILHAWGAHAGPGIESRFGGFMDSSDSGAAKKAAPSRKSQLDAIQDLIYRAGACRRAGRKRAEANALFAMG